MELEPRLMCEACGRKEVTHHLCQPGAVPHSISLCDDCMKTHTPVLVKDFMAAMENAVCRFCGNKAKTVDSFSWISDRQDADPRLLCFSCSTESNRVTLEKFQIFESESASLAYSEHSKRLREFGEQIDAHMRRWVIQRDN